MPEPIANASSIFLPWVRQGAAAAIQRRGHARARASRPRVSLPVQAAINDARRSTMTVRSARSGDVTGIDPHQVVRIEPKPRHRDFEPNYLAAIEFDRPDFPWLFTPAKAGRDGKLRPWLCLVVVRKQAGVALRADRRAPLPMLEIGAPAKPGDELPDLAESWAWAHAQMPRAQASHDRRTDANPGRRVRSCRCRVCCARASCSRRRNTRLRRAGVRGRAQGGLESADPTTARHRSSTGVAAGARRAATGHAAGLLPLGIPDRRRRRFRIAGATAASRAAAAGSRQAADGHQRAGLHNCRPLPRATSVSARRRAAVPLVATACLRNAVARRRAGPSRRS